MITPPLSATCFRLMPGGVILLCSIVLWWAVGANEIQPWDEGFYAVRALAVVEKGAWLDQTPYALGGLYTSTYPPLTIWAMSLSIAMFGTTEFAVRIYGALCGTAAFALMYGIARCMFSKQVALLAPVLLAGTVVWNHYARLGMLDIPLVSWMLLALWAILQACNAARSSLLGWCLVVALAMAAALMTKIVLSLLPLLFLVYVFRERGNTGTSWAIVGAIIAGFGIALPWHLWMIHEHGFAFYGAFMLPHITSAIEGSGRWLGPLFYLNQLFVAHPYAVLTLVWIAHLLVTRWWFRNKRLHGSLQGLDLVLVLWFVGGLVVFSFAATKMRHYTVVLVPPMILLSLRGAEHYFRVGTNRSSWPLGAVLVIAGVWSASQHLRDAVQQSISEWPSMQELPLIATSFVLFSVTLVAWTFTISRSSRLRYLHLLTTVIMFVIPVAMLMRVAYANATFDSTTFRGARETALWLDRATDKHFYYACQEYDPSDSLTPSLAWYTRGWTRGWRPGHTMTYVPLPLKWIGKSPVVYLNSGDPEVNALFTRSMIDRQLVLRTDGFLIFK